ncbi:hypothetical protein FQR65_LT07573 [Abscondita terminalis]|nr:hypothetical protein FQR65_LT07573 [Abscondita terminalis]
MVARILVSHGSFLRLPMNAFRGFSHFDLIEFKNTDIKTIESSAFNSVNTTSLLWDNCKIQTIETEAFFNFTLNTRVLNFSSLSLEYIKTGAFSGLVGSISKGIFSKNHLKRLHNSTFIGLGTMTELDLSFNSISKIEPGAFSLLPRLRTLTLKSNQLSRLMLNNMLFLEHLDLSYNFLGTFELILPELRYLNLHGNRLAGVGAVIPKLKTLNFLDLSSNYIKKLNPEELIDLKNLSHLNLNSNDLIAFDADSFLKFLPDLTAIDLSKNNFPCTDIRRILQPLLDKHLKVNGHQKCLVNKLVENLKTGSGHRKKLRNRHVSEVIFVTTTALVCFVLFFKGVVFFHDLFFKRNRFADNSFEELVLEDSHDV